MLSAKEIQLINEIGRRGNNEDYAGFNEGNLFVLCDGVGGNAKGEVASKLVVETFLTEKLQDEEFSLASALRKAEKAITEYIAQQPESSGMATTLVAAHFRNNVLEVAWVGDSRLYQFRNGELLFKTKDHSWVNEALEAGILTPEEAIDHPRKNIITRAVRGSDAPVELSTADLQDVQPDDLFLLCSDGVLETWSDDDFMALTLSSEDTGVLALRLKEECSATSRDNFTAIVFKVAVQEAEEDKIIPEEATSEPTESEPEKKSGFTHVGQRLISHLTKGFQKKGYDT